MKMSTTMNSILLLLLLVLFLFQSSVLQANNPSINPPSTQTLSFQPLHINQSYNPILKKAKRSRPPPPPPPPPPYVPTFDHFVLAETWPSTFCKIKTCVNPIPPPIKFKIHGLWPSNRYSYPKNCQNIWLDSSKIGGLLNKLEKDWSSLNKSEIIVRLNNYKFWNHEWLSHGTCSLPLLDQYEYFYETLKIYNKDDLMAILTKEKITPGGFVAKHDIFDAIKNHIKFDPQIVCKRIPPIYGKPYLLEIRLCLTASKDPQYKDCYVPYIGCNDPKVYY